MLFSPFHDVFFCFWWEESASLCRRSAAFLKLLPEECIVLQSDEASGDDAGGDEGSGFWAVDGFDQFGGGGFAFGFDVDDLAADHAGGERAVGAYSGADGEGDVFRIATTVAGGAGSWARVWKARVW